MYCADVGGFKMFTCSQRTRIFPSIGMQRSTCLLFFWAKCEKDLEDQSGKKQKISEICIANSANQHQKKSNHPSASNPSICPQILTSPCTSRAVGCNLRHTQDFHLGFTHDAFLKPISSTTPIFFTDFL